MHRTPSLPIAPSPGVAMDPTPIPRPTWRWIPSGRTPARRALDSAVTAVAVLGFCCLVAAALAASAGLRPFVVHSGSMAPEIPVGALVVARSVPATELEPGEVVSILRADGNRVTHRVVDVTGLTGSVTMLTLQGDANSTPDAERPMVSRADRVVLVVPHLGAWLGHLGSTSSWFVAGVLTGVALWRSFGPPTVRRLGRWTSDSADPLWTAAATSQVTS